MKPHSGRPRTERLPSFTRTSCTVGTCTTGSHCWAHFVFVKHNIYILIHACWPQCDFSTVGRCKNQWDYITCRISPSSLISRSSLMLYIQHELVQHEWFLHCLRSDFNGQCPISDWGDVWSQKKWGKSGRNVKRELAIIRGRSGPTPVARGSTVGWCTN